jgi:hypothetical protein
MAVRSLLKDENRIVVDGSPGLLPSVLIRDTEYIAQSNRRTRKVCIYIYIYANKCAAGARQGLKSDIHMLHKSRTMHTTPERETHKGDRDAVLARHTVLVGSKIADLPSAQAWLPISKRFEACVGIGFQALVLAVLVCVRVELLPQPERTKGKH